MCVFTPPTSLPLPRATFPKRSLPGPPELCSTQRESLQPAGSTQREVSLGPRLPPKRAIFIQCPREASLKDIEKMPSSHRVFRLGDIIVY